MTEYQHKTLAAGRWEDLPFHKQMANIGSEISRAIKWKRKNNEEQMQKAVTRCLELIDLTVLSRQKYMRKMGKDRDAPLPKGRPKKNKTIEDYEKENKRLRMEVALMRDFLQSTERK